MNLKDPLDSAIDAALAGAWDKAHNIVQDYNTPFACWIHAVLHKIEGDAWNSRYWYARTHSKAGYDDFSDPQEELREIRRQLDNQLA